MHQWELATRQIHDGGTFDLHTWFGFAWNREIPRPKGPPPGTRQLNLGAGYREVDWAESIDLEHGFDLEEMSLPSHDEEVGAIWAHGVFEHVSNYGWLLRECERVLVKGGVLNIVVPHGASFLQLEDPSHKTAWTEESWKAVLENEYYQPDGSPTMLRVHTCFIIGVVWRNLALFTQLVKE